MQIVVIVENGCVVGVYSTDPAIKEVAVVDLNEEVDRDEQLSEFVENPNDFGVIVEHVEYFGQIKI